MAIPDDPAKVMTRFRAEFENESDYPLSDSLYDYILANSREVGFCKGEALVDFNESNPDVYIICSGIIRGFMLEDGVETNVYFGMDGTFVAAMHCFSMGQPAIMRIEACCPTLALHISKADFDRMMEESHEFCRWVAGVFSRRSCFQELKAKVMNGDAKWRYEWLERCRPELFEHVPLKAIASYLKMTEVHVSRIRKTIATKRKN